VGGKTGEAREAGEAEETGLVFCGIWDNFGWTALEGGLTGLKRPGRAEVAVPIAGPALVGTVEFSWLKNMPKPAGVAVCVGAGVTGRGCKACAGKAVFLADGCDWMVCAGGTGGLIAGCGCDVCAGKREGLAGDCGWTVCAGGTGGLTAGWDCNVCTGNVGLLADGCDWMVCAGGTGGLIAGCGRDVCAGKREGLAGDCGWTVCAGGTGGLIAGCGCNVCVCTGKMEGLANG